VGLNCVTRTPRSRSSFTRPTRSASPVVRSQGQSRMLLVRVRFVGFGLPVSAGLPALPETSLVARKHPTNGFGRPRLCGSRSRLGSLATGLHSRGLADRSRRGAWNVVCHGNADRQTRAGGGGLAGGGGQ